MSTGEPAPERVDRSGGRTTLDEVPTQPIGLVLVAVLGLLSVLAIPVQPVDDQSSPLKAPPQMLPCALERDSFLRGRLYGEITETIDWMGDKFLCHGMVRPGGNGVRLFFAAPISEKAERLIIVLGIPGRQDELTDREFSVNVTIIDERNARFFSTGGQERCWTKVREVEPLAEDRSLTYWVTGEFYCAGSLPSLSDNTSVTLRDFQYAGRLTADEA